MCKSTLIQLFPNRVKIAPLDFGLMLNVCHYRIAQEQCCVAEEEDQLCDSGIKMARGQGACERPFFQGEPWETKISKVAP